MDDLSKSYQLLGLKPGASPEEAKQAYRDMVNVWHPDRFSHDERLRSKAQEKLKEINGAYEVIKASFFETSIAPEQATPAEPAAATEVPTADALPQAGNRVILWAILSGVALALIAVAAFLILKKEAPVSTGDAAVKSGTGQVRYALSCNQNGRVEISTTGSLTGTFTVECWTSTRRPRGTGTILCTRGPKDFAFDIKFREGKRFHGDIGDGSRWLARMANAGYNYNRNVWYHIAYVVTPTNYSIYVNGALIDDGQISPPGNALLYDDDHRLCLGADMLQPADLDGSIAEVRIWKTALTAEQIKANMNVSLTGKEPGLQGYWRFDEGSGTVTADNSGHGFTGKLVGDVVWTTNAPPIARP